MDDIINYKKQYMKTLIVSFVLFIGFVASSRAQTTESMSDFDFLVRKIKVDYPGYDVKVNSTTKPDLLRLEDDLRGRIKIYPDSCGKYMKQYADWFKDHHLRVRQIQQDLKKTETNPLDKQFILLNVDSLDQKNKGSGNIEGSWHSYRGELAILKDSKSDVYFGIALHYRGFEKNQLMFTLQPEKENEYSMIYYQEYNHFKPLKGKVSGRLNNKILELHDDTRIVKNSDSEVYDNAVLASYLAEFPNGRNTYPVAVCLSDSTFYMRISSFAGDYAETTTRKHWSEIVSRPNLIIDIRYNGGGQDYYQKLAELIYSSPYISKGADWYATKNNILFFEEAMKKGEIRDGEKGLKWTQALVDEMKKHPGQFVIHPFMGADKTISNDTVYGYPKRVGIIINEGNASSAEQFILTAKQSSKVTLFGNSNTAGVLDYSNAVPVNLPSGKFELVYPMTRSRRLPENPIDNIGIAPDIIIPYAATVQLYDRLDPWVYFVRNYLELMAGKK